MSMLTENSTETYIRYISMKSSVFGMFKNMGFGVRLLGFDFCGLLASYLIDLIPIL